MKGLAIVQLILCLFMFVANIWEGIIMLVGAIILGIIVCYGSWMLCIMYVFICMYDSFTCSLRVGGMVSAEDGIHGTSMALSYLALLKLPFYVVSAYYVF
jgi:hypothetical protein